MHVDLRPLAILWALLAAGVFALIAYRRGVARQEDDSLHVTDSGAPARQIAVAHRLEVIDKWGKILTVVAVAFGVIVGALYVYQGWVQASGL